MWDILLELGYEADGLYLGPRHRRLQRRVGRDGPRRSPRRGACTLIEVDLPTDHGFDIPSGAKAARRVPCSACGLSKRHLFDEAARTRRLRRRRHRPQPRRRGGRAVRQRAALGDRLPRPPAPGAARPATASRARSSRSCGWASGRWRPTACSAGIDYIVEECPMAAGNRHLGYKEALNAIEAASPGLEARLLLRLPRPGPRALFTPEARGGAGAAAAVRPRAARRRPARCARSAGWSSGPRPTSPVPVDARPSGRP